MGILEKNHMKTQYEFEPLGNSIEDGYNDPLKTIFGKGAETVTREAFQNSLDAVADESKPVRVSVSLECLTARQIPDAERLKKILSACAIACDKAGSPQGKRHFEHAKRVLASNRIPTLIISDFNTTGLTGGNEDKRSKYYNFFKSIGGHNKPVGAAGSYGFGKTTNMAFSEIDTFFATSNHGKGVLFMGCLRICSHKIDGKTMRGVGSYGLRGQLPLRDADKIPETFIRDLRREHPGTDIFIPAYKDHGDWKKNTLRSALKNFWLAIQESRLEIEIDGLLIQKKNLEQVMRKNFPPDKRTGRWRVDDPLPYFEAYTRGEKSTETMGTLGKVDCFLLPGDQRQSTGHVACFRKNLMLIQHRKFDSIVPYSGVFLCADERGNAVLQDLEPPQHDSWDKTVLHAQDENGQIRPECTAADKEYKSFIRERIGKLLGSRTSKRIELSSLNKFILIKDSDKRTSDNESSPNGKAKQTTNQEMERVRKTSVVLSAHHPKDASAAHAQVNQGGGQDLGAGSEEEEFPDIPREKPGPPGPPGPPSPPPSSEGVEPGKGKKSERVARTTLRAMSSPQNGIFQTNIIIRTSPPKPNKLFRVAFKAGTDDGFEALQVASVMPQGILGTEGDICGLQSDQEGKIALTVTFTNNSKYSLKADVYEVE